MLKPTYTPTRELVNLDGVWRFAIDTRLPEQPWLARLDTPLEAAVPASYNDLFADPEIRDHVGWVYYQREVRVPRGWGDDEVLLRFDAATHAARVYVDDRLVGEHIGGYTPFEVDLTDVVSAGSSFRLTVAVSGDLTNETVPPGKIEVGMDGRRRQTYFHDFYNYAGLARSVWLYSRPRTHVADITVVTGLDGATGSVDYRVETSDAAEVRVRLADATGSVVAEGTGAAGTLTVPDVTLWRPGAAYLYELTVEALSDEQVIDSYSVPVGVRTVEVRGHEFLINGEPFYFTGFGKHEDCSGARQGARRRVHGPRLPAHGVDRRELLPHLPLPLRRGGARIRRPPRHRRDRRDRRRRAQHGRRRRDVGNPALPDLLRAVRQREHAGSPRPTPSRTDRPRQEPPLRGHVVHRQRAGLERRRRVRVLRTARAAHS